MDVRQTAKATKVPKSEAPPIIATKTEPDDTYTILSHDCKGIEEGKNSTMVASSIDGDTLQNKSPCALQPIAEVSETKCSDTDGNLSDSSPSNHTSNSLHSSAGRPMIDVIVELAQRALREKGEFVQENVVLQQEIVFLAMAQQQQHQSGHCGEPQQGGQIEQQDEEVLPCAPIDTEQGVNELNEKLANDEFRQRFVSFFPFLFSLCIGSSSTQKNFVGKNRNKNGFFSFDNVTD